MDEELLDLFRDHGEMTWDQAVDRYHLTHDPTASRNLVLRTLRMLANVGRLKCSKFGYVVDDA